MDDVLDFTTIVYTYITNSFEGDLLPSWFRTPEDGLKVMF